MMTQWTGPPFPDLAITGHRVLPHSTAVAETLARILAHPVFSQSEMISPLAEGADRLAASEILKLPGGTLYALLPLEMEDYMDDFRTEESRSEFRDLLARAETIDVIEPQPTRRIAYRMVGRTVVHMCDILLAVWDGKPARGVGGTGEIVAYARDHHKPMILIDSEHPTMISCEHLPDLKEELCP